LQILSLLTGSALTAAEVARELGLTHANSSYHLRTLRTAGLIVVAGEEKIRGGVAKRYRYVVQSDRDEQARRGPRPVEQTRMEFTAIAHELIRRLQSATFTPGPKLLADADLWVEPQKWLDYHTRVAEAVRDLHEAAQPPRTPGTVRTSTTVAMFEIDSAVTGDEERDSG
jgi:DNA-binding transcriptional ArsR family regulator